MDRQNSVDSAWLRFGSVRIDPGLLLLLLLLSITESNRSKCVTAREIGDQRGEEAILQIARLSSRRSGTRATVFTKGNISRRVDVALGSQSCGGARRLPGIKLSLGNSSRGYEELAASYRSAKSSNQPVSRLSSGYRHRAAAICIQRRLAATRHRGRHNHLSVSADPFPFTRTSVYRFQTDASVRRECDHCRATRSWEHEPDTCPSRRFF